MNRWITAFLFMLLGSCQPSYADKDLLVTDKACVVAVSMSREVIKIFRDGGDQFQAMSHLNRRISDLHNPDVRVGRIYAQVLINDIRKNVIRSYTDQAIVKAIIKDCESNIGFEFAGSKI